MDKVKEYWAALVAKVGYETAVAVLVIAGAAVFVDPAVTAVGAVAYWLYKSGKLDKLIAKFKKTPDA